MVKTCFFWKHPKSKTNQRKLEAYTMSRPCAITIEPGQRVRHPTCPDWGGGQVQSAIGDRITVNFRHVGKILIDARIVTLELLGDADEAT
jgi:hypothetical protein